MPNSYDELWCLMDFMAAGCLGPAEAFHEHYSKHIKLGQKSNASAAELQKVRRAHFAPRRPFSESTGKR
jgi:hypothetical protein